MGRREAYRCGDFVTQYELLPIPVLFGEVQGRFHVGGVILWRRDVLATRVHVFSTYAPHEVDDVLLAQPPLQHLPGDVVAIPDGFFGQFPDGKGVSILGRELERAGPAPPVPLGIVGQLLIPGKLTFRYQMAGVEYHRYLHRAGSRYLDILIGQQKCSSGL